MAAGWHDARMDLEWERWTAMGDDDAQALVSRVAERVGAGRHETRPHQFSGRTGRIALIGNRLEGPAPQGGSPLFQPMAGWAWRTRISKEAGNQRPKCVPPGVAPVATSSS